MNLYCVCVCVRGRSLLWFSGGGQMGVCRPRKGLTACGLSQHHVSRVEKVTFLELSREVWIPTVHMPQAKNKSALHWEKRVQDSAECPFIPP